MVLSVHILQSQDGLIRTCGFVVEQNVDRKPSGARSRHEVRSVLMCLWVLFNHFPSALQRNHDLPNIMLLWGERTPVAIDLCKSVMASKHSIIHLYQAGAQQ